MTITIIVAYGFNKKTMSDQLVIFPFQDKLIALIEHTFTREKTLYWACNEERAFFTSDVYKNYNLWSCQNVCEDLVYLLDNIFFKFGTIVYRQTIGIPMGTNCAPLVADLFFYFVMKEIS